MRVMVGRHNPGQLPYLSRVAGHGFRCHNTRLFPRNVVKRWSIEQAFLEDLICELLHVDDSVLWGFDGWATQTICFVLDLMMTHMHPISRGLLLSHKFYL